MSLPAPFISGTVTYLVLTLLAVFAGVAMGITGKMGKENAS
jgi:V-type H+-transporting ATPase subunit e